MKHVIIIILLCLNFGFIAAQNDKENDITTYYLIRHAEKDRSNTSNRNPHLTEIGKQRAKHWKAILSNISFDYVYSTDYNRTKETALPTAKNNSLELTIYDPRNNNINSFLETTKGKTVLIVGHSNSTPNFVNQIIGEKKYNHIDDNNNGNLYIITIMNGKITDQVLLIN